MQLETIKVQGFKSICELKFSPRSLNMQEIKHLRHLYIATRNG